MSIMAGWIAPIVLGKVLQSGEGADRYQIDASVADFYRVGKKVVGRPTIYLVVDDCSRMIVGIHASLDQPS